MKINIIEKRQKKMKKIRIFDGFECLLAFILMSVHLMSVHLMSVQIRSDKVDWTQAI